LGLSIVIVKVSQQSGPAGASHRERPGPPRPWLTLGLVSAGLFLAVTSTTVVSVALPDIGEGLHADAGGLEWVVDAYTLVYATLLLPAGSLGDRLGRKGLFIAGTALFAAGALGCGLAGSLPELLAARVVQGAGSALAVSCSLTIIRATFDDARRRATAIGIWSTSSGVALAVGPPLGGVLASAFGWRGVFFALVAGAAATAAAGARWIPPLARVTAAGSFDWLGAGLGALAPAALSFGAIEGPAHGWTAASVLAAFGVGVAAVAAFIGWELTRPAPLVDVRLFGRRAFTAANLAALVIFFAFVGAIVYLSDYFQQLQHRTPVAAGLDVSAIGIAYAIAAALTGRLLHRTGERLPVVVGLLAAGVAALGLLRLAANTPIAAIWWNFALLGAAIGLCGTPISTIAMSAVDQRRAGMASGVVNAARQLGQAFGIAVLGALVYAHLPAAASAGPIDRAQAPLFVAGLHDALRVSGISLLAAGAAVAVLTRRPRAPGGSAANDTAIQSPVEGGTR
jgi:DHA2 family methylenomycin A resistance protein-like MFS transporter